ncbi:DNA-binding transcriptional regulator, XRE-family HTH domain [Virgibacillus subterraneus]|uniref:DNA-binding transcriptional regulator, XRE-family HTH domain n=2 Tax=Virgibacillus TaxID=84406 RepID=A0A1H0XMW2_9BACI|nr:MULTISPECIES: helix-turn-helix transcriptional regulator [Virgibacillus]SDQ04141.1 DNA-binding transcriptional regulator, XRE-family HTH domain [Virgibacillus salinus]SEQ98090.1 DNA-binding transcriptional regulator, XRE-family HTH domain [Virgibacillus subterraneus]
MDKQRLGRRIKAFRKLKGYTQVELAYKLDLPIITLGSIERGKQEASEKLLDHIADTLSVTKKELTKADETTKEE